MGPFAHPTTVAEYEGDSPDLLSRNEHLYTTTLPVGKPSAKPLFSIEGAALTAVCLISFAVGIVAIADGTVAVYLGQKYQLVAVGLCISIMSYCCQKQIQHTLISVETGSKGITNQPTILQNLDAILNISPFTPCTGVLYRFVLLWALLLPLGLGAAYKQFQGGQFTSPTTVRDRMHFGLTGPPGTQHIGYGVSLFVNATLPWFDDPGFDRVYGFNMYVANENRTAMLDGPLPSEVTNMQRSLRDGESRTVTGDVRALVCDLDPDLAHTRTAIDETFARKVQVGNDAQTYQQFVYNELHTLGMMVPNGWNYSRMWVSWFNSRQSFGQEVRQYSLKREWMRGTWVITPSFVALKTARALNKPSNDTHMYLEYNWIAVNQLFITAVSEYDYKFRNQGYSKHVDNTKYKTYVKSDSSLLASAVWARLVALNGAEVWGPNHSGHDGYTVTVQEQTTVTTLRRSPLLFLVLATNPAILLGAVLLRVLFYYSSPAGVDFGLISLLAAVTPDSLGILHGAALSGRLEKKFPLRFDVTRGGSGGGDGFGKRSRRTSNVSDSELVATEEEDIKPSIRVVLGEDGRNAKIKRGVVYH